MSRRCPQTKTIISGSNLLSSAAVTAVVQCTTPQTPFGGCNGAAHVLPSFQIVASVGSTEGGEDGGEQPKKDMLF